MAEAKKVQQPAEAPQELAKAQPLSPQDMAAGLGFERRIAVLQAQLDEAIMAQQRFVATLRGRYQAAEGEYELLDWLEGFIHAGAKGGVNGRPDRNTA